MYRTVTLFFITFFIATTSYASDWAEAEKLQRLVKHLEASKSLIDNARLNRNTDKRLQFDYESLEKNINEIQLGINVYLSKPIEPRSFEELKNSFSDYKPEIKGE